MNSNITLGLLRTAYNDYIAARVLINQNYIIQGLILASTAIEKYFKAVIQVVNGKVVRVHLDKLEKLHGALEGTEYAFIFDKIDPRFLKLLTDAYPLRYYDNITQAKCLGFFKNQFLGELDGAIGFLDSFFALENEVDGQSVLTPFQQNLKLANPDLLLNNWFAADIPNKKKFMETECEAFAVYIHPANLFTEVHVTSQKGYLEYSGSMWEVKIEFRD